MRPDPLPALGSPYLPTRWVSFARSNDRFGEVNAGIDGSNTGFETCQLAYT